MGINHAEFIRGLSDRDIEMRIGNVEKVLECNRELAKSVFELSSAYMYDRRACRSLGINYSDMSIQDINRIRLFAYATIVGEEK